MAKKNLKFELTPMMSLSILALFALMVPLFSLSNSQQRVKTSSAAVPVMEPSPTPTPAR